MSKDSLKKKKCPRCGYKMYLDVEDCPNCNLKFERIQNLSNKRAKEELKLKHYDNVINVTSMPNDVSKKKFWLLYFLLGWFGAYNIYIGKTKKGYYTLITAILAIISFCIYEIVFFQGGPFNTVYYYFTAPMFLFYLFGVIIWFLDLIDLTFHRFKYPATLTEEDYEKVITKKMRGR